MEYANLVLKIKFSENQFHIYLLFFALILNNSCKNDVFVQKSSQSNFTFETTLLDSILIESNNILRYLSYFPEQNQFLFLEENTNELILYDHNSRTQNKLSRLKEIYPEFKDQIYAGALDDSGMLIFTSSGYFKYSLKHNKIDYFKKGVVAQNIPTAIKVIKYKDKILSNMTLFESLTRDQFSVYSYSIYDSLGNMQQVLANPFFENYTLDTRIYIDFDTLHNKFYSYAFPYDKIYIGNLETLDKNPVLEEITINVDFLKEHPYYQGIKFGIEDFRYIPVVYDFHVTTDYIFLHLNEGGNRETKAYDGRRFLVIFKSDGEFVGQFNLEDYLSYIETNIKDHVFLFTVNPAIELPNHTMFKIVGINIEK